MTTPHTQRMYHIIPRKTFLYKLVNPQYLTIALVPKVMNSSHLVANKGPTKLNSIFRGTYTGNLAKFREKFV